jgi:hypothetical protein
MGFLWQVVGVRGFLKSMQSHGECWFDHKGLIHRDFGRYRAEACLQVHGILRHV